MSNFLAIMQEAADVAIPYMGQEIGYQGQTFTGVINEHDQSELLAIGGFEMHLSSVVTVSKTGFPTPVIGSTIQANGVTRRIAKVSDQPVTWTLYLDNINR